MFCLGDVRLNLRICGRCPQLTAAFQYSGSYSVQAQTSKESLVIVKKHGLYRRRPLCLLTVLSQTNQRPSRSKKYHQSGGGFVSPCVPLA